MCLAHSAGNRGAALGSTPPSCHRSLQMSALATIKASSSYSWERSSSAGITDSRHGSALLSVLVGLSPLMGKPDSRCSWKRNPSTWTSTMRRIACGACALSGAIVTLHCCLAEKCGAAGQANSNRLHYSRGEGYHRDGWQCLASIKIPISSKDPNAPRREAARRVKCRPPE